MMTWVIIGLGNPDEEYERTRHNAGRIAVTYFAEKNDFGAWKNDTKSKSHVVRGAIQKNLVVCVLPNTYMNKSGVAAAHFVKSVKAAERLIVVYDDLDLPFGSVKISFDRGSGGHKGIESIARTLKTTRFVRIRMGISHTNTHGETEKPLGEKNVEKFILGEFSREEFSQLHDVSATVRDAITAVVTDGRERAMNTFN